LELSISLAILAIVVLMSWPFLQGWIHQHRLGQGVDTVHAALVQARTLAMKEGRPYRFVCESGNTYCITADEPANSDNTQPRSTAVPVHDMLPEGVNFDGWVVGDLVDTSQIQIVFYPDGRASIINSQTGEEIATEVQLNLADAGKKVRALHVQGMTGSVTPASASPDTKRAP